jgi:hypothetical protein
VVVKKEYSYGEGYMVVLGLREIKELKMVYMKPVRNLGS